MICNVFFINMPILPFNFKIRRSLKKTPAHLLSVRQDNPCNCPIQILLLSGATASAPTDV